jgi:phenylpropionate dioxygenase-like ring-hydroxylating dioxygenase large terminal subunit
MRLCRAECGNAKSFTCSYHGWVHDMSGELVMVPFEQEAYHGEIDKSELSPVKVPRIEAYKGLVFGTWDLEAPSLLDYLGDTAWYMETFLDRCEGGTEPSAESTSGPSVATGSSRRSNSAATCTTSLFLTCRR